MSSETAPPVVRVEGRGPVRRLILNRPERHNAQNPQMWAELAAAGRALTADPDVRCVVLTGEGPSFSSGIDLQEMRAPTGFIRRLAVNPPGDPDPMLSAIADAQDAFRWIPTAPFVVIAAITGAAIGAGCQLALACDFRFVAADATLGLREVTLGLLPDLGATATFPRLLGRERALDLILTGRGLSGVEASALGLALHGGPASEVVAAATRYAATLAQAHRAALAYTKWAVDEPDPTRSTHLAGIGQAACIRTPTPRSPLGAITDDAP